MTAPFTQDLISAYLDGELTPKERAVVEQQLRDHAELKKMHDELRALGETLRTMPAVGPREGFAQRVLRAAERRMLTGETPAGNPPVVPHTAGSDIAASRRRTWPRNWRVVAGVLAMAASLMLLATWVFQPPGWDVAQAPDGDRLRAGQSASPLTNLDSAVRDGPLSSAKLGEAESAPARESLDRRNSGVRAESLAASPLAPPPLEQFGAPSELQRAYPPGAERRPDLMERAEQSADSSATRGGALPDEGVAALRAGYGEPTDTDPVAPRADGMGVGGPASKPIAGMGGMGGMGMSNGRESMMGGMAGSGRGAKAESSTAPGHLELGLPMRGGMSPTPQTDSKADFAFGASPADAVEDRVEERVKRSSQTPPIRYFREQLNQRQTLLLEVRWREPNINRLSAPPASAPFLPAQDAESARAQVPGLGSLDEPPLRRAPAPAHRLHPLDREDGEPMPDLIVVDATEEEIDAALAHLSEQAVLIPVDAEAELEVLRHFAVPPISAAAAPDSPADVRQRAEPSPHESSRRPSQSIVGTLMEEANVSRDRFRVGELAAKAQDSRTGKSHDGEGSEYIMFRLIHPLSNPCSLPEADKQE